MTRFGLSGTNWTRKTTTIRRLEIALHPRPIEIVSLSAFIARCPYPVRQDQTLRTSRWMVEQVSNVLAHQIASDAVQIFDRTPVDVCAFTLYASERPEAVGRTQEVTELINEIRAQYARFDRIFICRPGDEWPNPVLPSEKDLVFAKLIDEYLDRATALGNERVIELPWESDARLSEILTWLREKE
jgi:hypothetical protein